VTQVPTNRGAASSVAEHTSDHNIFAAQHNELDGHAADTAAHGVAATVATAIAGLVDSYVALAPAPTGVAATDTAAIQALLDAAALAGGGQVRLARGGYVVTGLTIDTAVWLVGEGTEATTITLAAGADTYLLATEGYATLVAGDTTGGPRDFGVTDLTLDGAKASQTATDPVLAIYGRHYSIRDVLIRNGKGTGLYSKWSTTSPFQVPNGFESFVTNLLVHSCDGSGVDFNGPHDTFFSTFFIVKCGASATAYPLHLPDSSGRANGSNFAQFHIYGGNGYNHAVVCNTAGVRLENFVAEGAQIAQVLLQASQVMLDGFHLYTGGIQTATAKGIQLGDATHTNVNGCTIRGRVENCGGGAIDVTYGGWNNDIDVHHFYASGTAPSKTDLGVAGTLLPRTKLLLRTTDSVTTFAPTAACDNRLVGPVRAERATAADTRDLLDLRNEAGQQMMRVDWRGRRRVTSGTGAPIPTIAVGAQAGTGATVAVTGDDTAGKVTVTTGTGAVPGTLATVTFSGAFGNAPFVVLTPKDVAGAALGIYNGTSTSAFSVKAANVPATSTAYTFDYIVVGA
jgi:hypothetical protein